MGETYHILDLGGLLLKRFHGSSDKCWQTALLDFIDAHLLPYLGTSAPRQMIAVLDKGNTFRLNLWPAYKKRRLEEEREPEQAEQIALLRKHAGELLAYLGVKQVWVPGEEADDVIALLCGKLEGIKLVHTVDQDLLVLVDEHTSVLRNNQLHSLGVASVEQTIPYPHISLSKALVGDPSDGYGGVPGFGEKAWEKLYEQIQSPGMVWLQWVIDQDAPEQLAPYTESSAQLDLIYRKWTDARRGWALASLHPEACYGSYRSSTGKEQPKRPTWLVRVPNAERVQQVIAACCEHVNIPPLVAGETERYMGQLERWFPTQMLADANVRGWPQVMQEILASPVVSYDFESSDRLNWQPFRQASTKDYVDVLAQELAGISINWGDNLQHTIYVPFDHRDTANLPLDWAKWLLSSLSSRPDRCVVQNAAFELTVAQRHLGYMPRAPYDTAIMASYVDENEENGLKVMSSRLLGYKQLSYMEVTQGRAMWELSGEEVLRYGCDDSLVTSHIFDLFRLIMQIEGSWDFYRRYEVDPAVDDAHNFITGTEVDFERLRELETSSKARTEKAEAAIRTALAEHVPQQDAHGLTVAARTLLSEWWLTEQYKFFTDGEYDAERANARYQALWEKACRACVYEAKQEQRQSREFIPTPLGVGAVVKAVDATAPVPSKLTRAAILEWRGKVAGELMQLADLLLAAQPHLPAGKRTGPAYEELADFCQSVLDGAAPAKVTSTGTQLNFGSAPQMQEMLYGLLRLPVRRRSKPTEGSLREVNRLEGAPATGLKAVASALVWDVLEGDWRREVLENYAVVRKEQQLQSLYFDKYPLWQHPFDGKIHPQIRNCGTATRRPAGNSPNMLQLKKGEIRTMFRAGEGNAFVSLDFAGQELVLTACASNDPVMLDAFMQTPRLDVHSLTASGIAHRLLPRLGVPVNSVLTYEEFLAGLHSSDEKVKAAYKTVRNKYAKMLAFGIIYGSSALGVAETLQIPKQEAEDLVDSLFALYKRIPEWQREVALFAREHGYVEMPFGSRRHAIADLWSDDRKLSGRQDRQLSNAVIQSGAAEILKVVRQSMYYRQMRERYDLRQVFPIYDEVTAVVPLAKCKDYILEMADIMRVTPPGYPVGMEVEASIGLTWGNQIEVGLPTADAIDHALKQLTEVQCS